MLDRARFVEEWSQKLAFDAASLFVGAGTSIGAGYPSWRALLRKVASELGLDIDDEYDLAAVAQHYINKDRTKGRLTQMIVRQFPRKPVPAVLRRVARLPLRRIWTTNWDDLIETAFTETRREPDVKDRASDLHYERHGSDVTVYKMHGSLRNVAEVVLSTEDFELYRITREAFLRVLAGHLISTSFLFIGVSFTDPNLGQLLAGIREMYARLAPERHGQPHYAILRAPQASDFGRDSRAAAKLETATIRHQLFVEDLKRYNIHCVGVERHEEADEILAEVEQRLALRAVFVSGSLAAGALSPADEVYVQAVARTVGSVVARADKRLVSGYGAGIGDRVVSGMLGAGWLDSSSNLDKRMTVRPFPLTLPAGLDRETFNRKYREDLIALAGVCVVVCGIRPRGDGTGHEESTSVHQEVQIARELGRVVIPIGATHGAAASIWKEMASRLDELDVRIPRADFVALGVDHAPPERLGQALLAILHAVQSGEPHRA